MRRIAIGSGILVLVLVGVGGFLFVYRGAIVEPLLAQRLSALLGAPVQLSVEEVSFGEVRATGVRFGENEELRIGTATVRFHFRSPFGIELEEVALNRVELQVDMTGGGPMLGSLQAALASDHSGGPDFRLPTIEISEGRINITFEHGTGTIAFDGYANTNDVGATEGEFKISGAIISAAGETIGGLRGKIVFAVDRDSALSVNTTLSLVQSSPRLAPISTGEVVLSVTGDRLSLHGSLFEAEGAASLAFGSTITNYRREPNANFRLSARVASRSDIWARLNLPVPSDGAAELLIEGTARLPALTVIRESTSPFDDFLTSTEMDGRLDVVLLDLVHDRIGKLNGSMGGRLTLNTGGLSLQVPEGKLFYASDFVNGVARIPIEGDTIRLSVPEGGALQATISSSPSGFTMIGEGSLLLEGPGEAALWIDSQVTTRMDEQFRLKSIVIGEYLVRLTGADFRPWVDLEGATIQLRGEAAFSEEGHLNGTAKLEANAASLSRGRAAAGPVKIQATADFAWDGSSANIRLSDRGEIHAKSVTYGDALSIPGRFRAQIHRLDVVFSHAEGHTDTPRFFLAAEVEPEDFVAELGSHTGAKTRLDVSAGQLSAEAAISTDGLITSTIGLSDVRLAALGQGATFSGLSARVTMDTEASSARASFEIARLEQTSKTPVVVPLRMNGVIDILSGRIEASARVFHSGDLQVASLALSSRDDVTRLSVEVEEISFSPAGLQPRDLFPNFDFLRSTEGSVRAHATVTLTNGEIQSRGTLEFDTLSFASQKGSVRSLQGKIVFDTLWPPSTPAGQRLTAEGASFVLPTDTVEAIFQLLPGEPVRILLEKGRAGFVGGILSTSDALIDPSAAAQDFVINVQDIDLEKLLGLLAIEGLSGTGTISGDVPVSVLDTGAVIIRNSELRSRVPGVIRLKSETVAQALKGGGESVNLMLRALEDFHYQSLVLSADKAEDGEATILLSLSGQNPTVLEGQPFDFNIRLGTNLDTISRAVRQGLGVSGNIFGNLQ